MFAFSPRGSGSVLPTPNSIGRISVSTFSFPWKNGGKFPFLVLNYSTQVMLGFSSQPTDDEKLSGFQ